MKLLSSKNKIKENKFKDYIIDNKSAFYRIAYSYVKNEDDALDIVQESICKGLSSINKLENIDYVKPWFYKILINTSIDYIRKNKKYVHVQDEFLELNSCEYSISVDSEIDIQRALDNLSNEYKSVIILRYFEDLKISDIATVLNENENTIKTRLYRALKILKLEIEETL
ncbi:MAG: sigma-70 family RNA polymerase sigma factor [Peptostreptococcaceae bacterium]